MLRFELAGTEVVPNDLLDFTLALGEQSQISITDKLVFEGASARVILDEYEKGNIQKKLDLNIWNNGTQVYRGFADMQDSMIIHGDRGVEVAVKSYDNYEWIQEFAKSVSFGVLEQQRYITQTQYKRVNYVQNFKPDVPIIISSSIALYNVTEALIKATRLIQEISIQAAPLSLQWLKELAIVAVKIIYVILLMVAISVLLNQLIEALFPNLGWFHGILIVDMFKAICNYFGLTFRSSIFEGEAKDIVYIPYKDELQDIGIPNPDSPLYNCGDFLESMARVFNAQIRIKNGELIFERWDYFLVKNDGLLKRNFNDQERLLNTFTLNTDEAIGNYNIFYQTDAAELNTLDGDTLSFQESIEGIKGLATISLPFAQAKNKNTRTKLDENLTLFQQLANKMQGLFGSRNRSKNLKNTYGNMLVSGKTFSVDKIGFYRNGSIDTIPATWFWTNFHNINSYTVNQWVNYETTPMEMTFEEFKSLTENNTIIDGEGREVQITEAVYNPTTNKANVGYRERKIYAKGLKAEII